MKTLYFDIDGTINDYHDVTKRRLSDGTLQKLLIRKGFERLVCVSGWTTMIRDASRNPYFRPTMEQQIETLRQVIVEAFPDKEDFHARCKLEFENDQRGRHINLAEDFYYLDDWAKEFFEKHHGPGSYAAYESTRILGVVQNRLFLGDRSHAGNAGVVGSLQDHRKMQRAGA